MDRGTLEFAGIIVVAVVVVSLCALVVASDRPDCPRGYVAKWGRDSGWFCSIKPLPETLHG